VDETDACGASEVTLAPMADTRTEFGYVRTSCDCRLCRVFCRHYPGFLIPADLKRLIPPGRDPFEWAREHLRVRVRRAGRPAAGGRTKATAPPIAEALLPATADDGACQWYRGERCTVHADSPFGCAFFDQHQSDRQARNRAEKGFLAILRALEDRDSLYRRLCDYLVAEGLTMDQAAIRRAAAAARRELDNLIECDAHSKGRRKKRP